eukprot:scaffold43478_cov19-Tisochrysis_lutea.AAC.1
MQVRNLSEGDCKCEECRWGRAQKRDRSKNVTAVALPLMPRLLNMALTGKLAMPCSRDRQKHARSYHAQQYHAIGTPISKI